MTAETIILIVGFTFGFYMAWNIGANDVANSMASAVGAKAITIRQAVFIAGILNIVGATFIGSHVTNTIRKGIISTEVMSDPHLALAGALAALLAAALWVSFALHRRRHDRFRHHGRRFWNGQLGKTGGCSAQLGDFSGYQHGDRLCHVQDHPSDHHLQEKFISKGHTLFILFYQYYDICGSAVLSVQNTVGQEAVPFHAHGVGDCRGRG